MKHWIDCVYLMTLMHAMINHLVSSKLSSLSIFLLWTFATQKLICPPSVACNKHKKYVLQTHWQLNHMHIYSTVQFLQWKLKSPNFINEWWRIYKGKCEMIYYCKQMQTSIFMKISQVCDNLKLEKSWLCLWNMGVQCAPNSLQWFFSE